MKKVNLFPLVVPLSRGFTVFLSVSSSKLFLNLNRNGPTFVLLSSVGGGLFSGEVLPVNIKRVALSH